MFLISFCLLAKREKVQMSWRHDGGVTRHGDAFDLIGPLNEEKNLLLSIFFWNFPRKELLWCKSQIGVADPLPLAISQFRRCRCRRRFPEWDGPSGKKYSRRFLQIKEIHFFLNEFCALTKLLTFEWTGLLSLRKRPHQMNLTKWFLQCLDALLYKSASICDSKIEISSSSIEVKKKIFIYHKNLSWLEQLKDTTQYLRSEKRKDPT